MVLDLSDASRVYTFIEGLLEPLHGLVKSCRPSTLQEVVTYARDLQGAIPKTRAPIPSCIPYHKKGSDTRSPPQRATQGRGLLDEETRRDLRRRKLCFTCQELGRQAIGAKRSKPIILRSFGIVIRRTMWSWSMVGETMRV